MLHSSESGLGLHCLLRPVFRNTPRVIMVLPRSDATDHGLHLLPFTIGIKHGFSCIYIRQVPWEVLKTEAEGHGFQHLPRDLANVNALKNHV